MKRKQLLISKIVNDKFRVELWVMVGVLRSNVHGNAEVRVFSADALDENVHDPMVSIDYASVDVANECFYATVHALSVCTQ